MHAVLGGVFPLGGEGMVVVWWRNPPARKGKVWSTSRRCSSWVELEGRSTTACTYRMVLLGVDITATFGDLEGALRSAGFPRTKDKGIYLKV